MKPTTIILLAVLGSVACSPSRSDGNVSRTPVTGVEWTLVELEGDTAPTGAEGKPVTLTLFESERRASGFSGCNQYSSAYEMDGGHIHFTPPISTRMACEAGMDLEQRYLKVFEGSTGFRQTAAGFDLIGAGDQVVARFEKR